VLVIVEGFVSNIPSSEDRYEPLGLGTNNGRFFILQCALISHCSCLPQDCRAVVVAIAGFIAVIVTVIVGAWRPSARWGEPQG
jgi:hypothetical protein